MNPLNEISDNAREQRSSTNEIASRFVKHWSLRLMTGDTEDENKVMALFETISWALRRTVTNYGDSRRERSV